MSTETEVAGQYPVETYWYVTNSDAHVVVHVASGNNSLLIELSRKKTAYNFPADYSITPGGYNDFIIYAEDNSGQPRQLLFAKNASINIKVDRLDPAHLQLTLEGSLTGKDISPFPVKGKISLIKDPSLERLPDSYPGCDNTIYNKMSPNYDLGQWRTATACEISFHKQVCDEFHKAFDPVYTYLRAKDWIITAPACKPLEMINKSLTGSFFKLTAMSRYRLDASANPMKGEYQQYTQRLLEQSTKIGAAIARGDTSGAKQLRDMGKEVNKKFELHLEIFTNEEIKKDYSLDLSTAQVKKINDSEYIIDGAECSGCTYSDDGGTYILLGHWSAPLFDQNHISATPNFGTNAKKLSVQAFYIRLGCGQELAKDIMQHIDFNALKQLLQIIP
jgi:hypothetical protein